MTPDRIEEKLNELSAKVDAILNKGASWSSNTLLRAEVTRIRKSNGTYKPDLEFDQHLEKMKVDWWPVKAKTNFPNEDDEVDVNQPFVSEILNLFVSGKVVVKKKKKTTTVSIKNIPDPNAFKKFASDRRATEARFYDGLTKCNTLSQTMLGQVTGYKDQYYFSDSEIGQLLDDFMRLLKHQPFRLIAFGFLTDGNRFLFVRCTKYGDQAEDVVFKHSSIFLGQAGWQILFGLMQAEPKSIGYTTVSVPGFNVEEVLGRGAFSTVFKGIPIPGTTATISLPEVELPPSLSIQPVLGEGNCFFHAIADQLQRQDIRDANGEGYTHELLRTFAHNRVDNEPRFRQMMTDRDYLDLSRINGWIDTGSIGALARALQINITIYGHPGGLPVRVDSNGNFDHETVGLPVLQIAYNGYNRYDSVIVTNKPLQNQEDKSREEESLSEDFHERRKCSWIRKETHDIAMKEPERKTTPNKKAKKEIEQNISPVAIKFFRIRRNNENMRDHESFILEKLKPNYNVPYVVKSCDLKEGAVLIVGPVGQKVLPVRNGVRTFVPDYLKLLQVLEEAHKKDICHRDVKPENIFKDETGRIILSDWSSCAETGIEADWAGTEFYYQKQVRHIPQPQDDLVALVRSVYLMTKNQQAHMDVHALMENNLRWGRALELARSLDYDELRKSFNTL